MSSAEGADPEGGRASRRRTALGIGFLVVSGLVGAGAVASAVSLDGLSRAWWVVLLAQIPIQVGLGVVAGLYLRPRGVVDPLRGLSRRQRRRLEWAEAMGRVVDDPAVARVAIERAEARLSGLAQEQRVVSPIVRGAVVVVLVAALFFLSVAIVVWYRGNGVDLLLLGLAAGFGLVGPALPRCVRRAQRWDARRLERTVDRWRAVAE